MLNVATLKRTNGAACYYDSNFSNSIFIFRPKDFEKVHRVTAIWVNACVVVGDLGLFSDVTYVTSASVSCLIGVAINLMLSRESQG